MNQRKSIKKIPFYLSLLIMGILYSCSSNSQSPNEPVDPDPEITSISPTEGAVGTEVTITGSGFLPTPTENTVTFDGTPAEVSSATATTITARVAEGTTSGPVAVTVEGKTADGPVFEVLDPEITSINPTEGTVGTEVTITGSGFLPTPSENAVTFNETPADVISATATTITARVAEETTSGPVAVIVGGKSADGPVFEVLPRQIAFSRNQSGDLEIWRINLDGSDPVNLTNDAGRDCCHQWSPDGSQLTFGSTRTGTGEIWVMDADGSNQTPLTTLGTSVNPYYSPDGTKILFERIQPRQIWVMDSDGSNPTAVTEESTIDELPTWSPAGDKIIFKSTRSGYYDLWSINSDGSNPVNLSDDPRLDQPPPSWSPDGSNMVFERNDDYTDIWIMNSDGSGQVNLTNNPVAHDFDPQWSPDGSKIAFINEETGDFEIYVMDTDGSNRVNLTNDNTGNDRNPRWSPDGSKLIFFSDRTGDNEIWVMDADGSNQTQVTSMPGTSEYNPRWRTRN